MDDFRIDAVHYMILGEIGGSSLYHLVVCISTLILPLSTQSHTDLLKQAFLTRILYVAIALALMLGYENVFTRNGALVYMTFHLAMGVNASMGIYTTKTKCD